MSTIEIDEVLNQVPVVNRRWFGGLLAAIAVASAIPGIVQAQDTPVANRGMLTSNNARTKVIREVVPCCG
jgi:hypothetical protein